LARPSRRLADGRRTVSGVQPCLAGGQETTAAPGRFGDHVLLHSSAANDDDWRLWLTAAGLPTNLSKATRHNLRSGVHDRAGRDRRNRRGHGRTSYVEADIAKGRLVVPFKITLPADAGFYLVSPEAKADTPKLSAFRQWLKASIHANPKNFLT